MRQAGLSAQPWRRRRGAAPVAPRRHGSASLLAGCGRTTPTSPPPPPTVTVEPARAADRDRLPRAHRQHRSPATASIWSPGSRATSQSVNFNDGSIVKKGDLLVRDRARALRGQRAAGAGHGRAAAGDARPGERGIRASAAADQAEGDLRSRTWRTGRPQRDGRQGRRRRGQCQARARPHQPRLHPGGRAVRRPDRPPSGRCRQSGRAPARPTQLATIDQIAPIYVYFNVDEQRRAAPARQRCAPRARRSRTWSRSSSASASRTRPAIPHEATLDFVGSDVDQSTGTLQVRGAIPNQDYVFLPGLFVRVRMPVGTIDERAPGARIARSASTSAATTCWSSTRTTWSSSGWSRSAP